MSRGKLDKETALRIESELPNVRDVRVAAVEPNPDLIS